MRRAFIIAIVVVAVSAGGLLAYRQFGPRPAQAQRADPGVAVATAIRILERSEQHRLTEEQIRTVLPLLRVLRDTDLNDVEPSRALADEIRSTFTPAQLDEVARVREEAQRRRQSAEAGRPGSDRPGGGQGFGAPGGGPTGAGRGFSRAEFRKQILSRLIERLESRL